MADQAGQLAYAHGSVFTTEPLEAYAAEVGAVVPVDDPAIYPVSGGSEAIETALKLARAYHLARGEPEREILVARHGSYHGNTLGALDLSGRPPLRRPYEPWLGRFRHVSAAYPYRADEPEAHALADASALAAELEQAIPGARSGAGGGVRRRADRRGHARRRRPARRLLAGASPRSCARHGVLLIADEVMTGFGRTGRWFGLDHWGVRPDLLVAAKGATSGYWPFGFVAASGRVFKTVTAPGAGFVHGFTFSHSPVGAAVAREVLRILRDEDLVAGECHEGRATPRAVGGPARRTTRRSGRSAAAA